jgi:hypothetical protein
LGRGIAGSGTGAAAGIAAFGGSSGPGIDATGTGAGAGIRAASGLTGHGIQAIGGATSGDGFNVSAAGSGLDINAPNSDLGTAVVSAAAIRAAVGLATANLDTQLAPLPNLDATITSRMATYTQPTGFLAATFPTTVASPTNITAGTITNVTNLTNAPTAGDFTATMKASLATATQGTIIEGTVTLQQSLRLANSANGGKLSGAATATVAIRDLADTKDRVVATVDASGNRTAVSRDLT